jgi:hypothetical protein
LNKGHQHKRRLYVFWHVYFLKTNYRTSKCLDVATFSHTFHLEMSELISCVVIHTCMHAFICLILFVARSSVVSLQEIHMSKYIQSTFVLVSLIQGIQIGFYVWTLIWCIYLIASSPCCTWKLINDNTQHPKLQQRNTWWRTWAWNYINVFELLLKRDPIWIPWIRDTNTNVDCMYFDMCISWRLTTELLATQSIKHIKACMHVWITTQEINSDISKWNVCEKVATSRHLATFTELSKYLLLTELEPSTISKRH